jgi:two-component system cell cycle response regulator DivK
MSAMNLQNKRVLVVEDDEMSYLYLSQLLTIAKVIFVREKTGVGAIQQFRNNPGFDAILMDIQLPDMDGRLITTEIRKLNPLVPIIAQTASRSVPDLDMMIEAGCNAILIKPFTMDQLFHELEKVLGQLSI